MKEFWKSEITKSLSQNTYIINKNDFARGYSVICHWYFTGDYNLQKFYDITVILTEDYNLVSGTTHLRRSDE